jgi:beta-glucanase (GH16 family)
MDKFIIPILILPAVLAAADYPVSSPDIDGWELLFEEPFDTIRTSGDPRDSLWKPYNGIPGTQSQTYWRSQNLVIEDGILRMVIKKEEYKGKPYTAGGLDTEYFYTGNEGRYVVRARFQDGYGYQGYICMFPTNGWPPEVDFAEVRGNYPQHCYFTQHYRDGEGKIKNTASRLENRPFTKEFHEYTLLWDEGRLIFIVDSEAVDTMEQRFENTPMYLAMGCFAGACGQWADCPDNTTPSPVSMDIDYVRIYTKSETTSMKITPVDRNTHRQYTPYSVSTRHVALDGSIAQTISPGRSVGTAYRHLSPSPSGIYITVSQSLSRSRHRQICIFRQLN